MSYPKIARVVLSLLPPAAPGGPQPIVIAVEAAGGPVGWSACGYHGDRWAGLERLARAVIGTVPSDTTRRHQALGLAGEPLSLQKGDLGGAGALDNAVLDLAARCVGVPLALWLGGTHNARVAVADRLRWTDAPADLTGETRVRALVERAEARVARHGFATVTVVCNGVEPDSLVALLTALRRAFGSRIDLRLDMTGLPAAAARPLVGPARELAVSALIEPGIDVSIGPERTLVPIAVSACPEHGGILKNGVAQIMRILTNHNGGAAVSLRLAALARVFQAEVLLGAGSGLAVEAALLGQLARATPADLQPLDLGPDPVAAATDGVTIAGGMLMLPDGPGLGIVPDPARLARAERRAEIAA
jgi:L-alanine-DL-glutamate epimerase-like enolase superfamily enzyme